MSLSICVDHAMENCNWGQKKGSHATALSVVMTQGFERPLIFTIEDDPPKREMSRFLCKMAFESVAEIFCSGSNRAGHLVDEPFFDNVRKFARYGDNFNHWPFFKRRVFPHETFMRHTTTNEWVQAGFGCGLFMNKRNETLFAFIFYGVEFVINVGGPSIAGYDEWLREHNGISPVVERLGCSLVRGDDVKHYLHGTFEVKNGLEFDEAHGYGKYGDV